MNVETDSKIDSIIISAVNRLYKKEELHGLDYDDLRCLEILYKIKKEAKFDDPTKPREANKIITPENLVEMLKAVRGTPANGVD